MLDIRDVPVHAGQLMDRRWLAQLVATTSDLVFVAPIGHDHVVVNDSAHEFFGDAEARAAATAVDGTVDRAAVAARMPPRTRQRWKAEIAPELADAGLWEGELTLFDIEGERVTFSVVLVTITGDEADRASSAFAGVLRDVTARKAFEERLEYRATHDPLTGLPNRSLFLDRVTVALGRASRGDHQVGLLFIDVDRFKVVNDSLGHGAGDHMLVMVARRIAAAVRPGDTVSRFGGDEFAVLCQDLRSADEAHAIAARIEEEIAGPVTIGATEMMVSLSIGIATSRGIGQDPEGMLQEADTAMYEAKVRRRSPDEHRGSPRHERFADRLALETSLLGAAARGEIALAYAPQVQLDSGRIVGLDVSPHWNHPDRGRIDANDLLSIAADAGLAASLGEWMMTQACRMVTGVTATVDLTRAHLFAPELAKTTAQVLAATGLPPGALAFEVSESTLSADSQAAAEILDGLRVVGVGLVIDDFGTGTASLTHLRRFPVDTVKLGPQFVDRLGHDGRDRAMAEAVVRLAHALDLSVIATGVETTEQRTELHRLGCDLAQGPLFGPLLGPDALADLV